MARLLRVQYEGAIFHVTVRGNAQQAIFLDDRDRERFLNGLARQVEAHGVRLYLFCLMPNHMHLLLETPRANLSAFMGGLLTGYTVYFNRRHQRSGHVTQGRYGAKVVEGDEYLDKLSRYIHLNPVQGEGIRDLPLKERRGRLRGYRWSTYPSYIGQAKRLKWVRYSPVLAMMGRSSRRYREYVEYGLAGTDEEFLMVMKKSALGIGTAEFCREMEDRYEALVANARQKEDVALRIRQRVLPEDEMLKLVGEHFGIRREALVRRRRNAPERAVAAWLLVRHAGLTQREVGVRLAMGSGAAVSLQLKRLHQRLKDDRALQWKVTALESALKH